MENNLCNNLCYLFFNCGDSPAKAKMNSLNKINNIVNIVNSIACCRVTIAYYYKAG